jgi:hypothetical protein
LVLLSLCCSSFDRDTTLVKRGVFERGKLQELYLGRRKELEAAQGRVREELKSEKETRLHEQTDQYNSWRLNTPEAMSGNNFRVHHKRPEVCSSPLLVRKGTFAIGFL